MFDRSINKAFLIGRLGADPEVRYTPSGAAVANFNLATNRSWKGKDGNRQEETTWHRIVVWRGLAELAKEYLKKGNMVYVEGHIQNRTWEDQNGQKHYVSEIVASDLKLLDGNAQRSSSSSSPAAPPVDIEPPQDVEPNQDEVPF